MKILTLKKALIFVSCFIFASSAWAYGSGGGTSTACKKPEFSAMSPAHLAEVAPGAAITFKASARTDPSSISVTAKKLPVKISVTKNNSSYSVTGKLPISLQGTFARIVITAKSASGCEGTNKAWLVKVSGESASE
jgi:IS5 family transposase